MTSYQRSIIGGNERITPPAARADQELTVLRTID